jgi:hypothetical protein
MSVTDSKTSTSIPRMQREGRGQTAGADHSAHGPLLYVLLGCVAGSSANVIVRPQGLQYRAACSIYPRARPMSNTRVAIVELLMCGAPLPGIAATGEGPAPRSRGCVSARPSSAVGDFLPRGIGRVPSRRHSLPLP